ncbi:MAG: Gfo/Idh/MocA family oxidoreductase [Acidobacteria bacterium]|nr:Gfo/Idh/MocA family oxidoreductase [Acidobacteriota bacterium]
MKDRIRESASNLPRREFLRLGTLSALGASLPAFSLEQKKTAYRSVMGMPFEKMNPRIGIIGTGKRGTSLLRNFIKANAQIRAICDIDKVRAENARQMVEKSGQLAPAVYTQGERDFENLVARDDLDWIVIATPWNWHVEMAVAAMKHGKHAGVEVPAATTLEDCWRLVNTSEKTQRHCIMLENCCYGYNETLVLRMIHAGLLGELQYGEAAYIHDLRDELFWNRSEGLWRRTVHTQRDGNLYPTHGLGPVANYMGIQRGDRFDSMVSMSSPHRGLELFREQHVPEGDPRQKEHYVTGDMNVSLIKTGKGLTITLKHNVASPHPYDRINQIAGTKGVFEDYPPRIYLDGQAGGEDWTTLDKFKQYEHPLWTQANSATDSADGHGGMDFIMISRLLQCFRSGVAPDMDVYDAAAWSAPGPLSALSLARGNAPVKFPDFTRGHWKERGVSPLAVT